MNLIEQLAHKFKNFLLTTFSLDELPFYTFDLNADEAKAHGDISTNAAMVLARTLKKSPRDIAQQIVSDFTDSAIQKIEIAGPGFINITLTNETFATILMQMTEQKESFFKSELQQKRHYNIEFVSANPTGPLHFGHGRGGIIGDVLGNVLNFLGHDVTKEYYINDAGAQITKLGNSFKIRCLQELGQQVSIPEEGYHGEYLVELAKECVQEYGNKLLEQPDSFFAQYAKDKLLTRIKTTLDNYGIHFDVWFSEKSLHTSSAITQAIQQLTENGYTYEAEGAFWFKSTKFGDDKDRVLRKSDGELTYAAADVAYMLSKVNRGANHLMYVLGHDHHSYAIRLDGIRQALQVKAMLDVILYQLVSIKEDGQYLRMSKRAGRMVTLEDIIGAVGKDVARFFYLNKNADAQLEFDLGLALKKTDENPVFYIQYAYVRIGSILNKAAQEGIAPADSDAAFVGLEEHALLQKIIGLKHLLTVIGNAKQPYLLASYAIELSTLFHRYYNQNRVLGLADPNKTKARLLILQQLRATLALCFNLLGISAPEKM